MEKQIMVSVYMATYNHEKYIRQALESVVNQNTKFNYEIIVHDDASTDGTQAIILEYQRNYPDLIVPVLQTINQYQLGVERLVNFVLPIARGEYFAMNEGDDFWTDNYKLQKQVDYMELNRNCTLVTHKSNRISETGDYLGEVYTPVSTGAYTIKDILMNHTYFTTNSMLVKMSTLKEHIKIFEDCPSFDYIIKTIAILSGEVHALKDNMSSYRIASNGSWTSRMVADKKKYINHIQQSIDTYKYIDKHFHRIYHDEIQACIMQREFELLMLESNYKMVLNKSYKQFFSVLPTKAKIKIYIGSRFPKLLKLLIKIGGKSHE